MVKIDGKLTDATFKVMSEAIHVDENGNRVFVFCCDTYTIEVDTIDYISGILAEHVRAKYSAKNDDRIYINITYNTDNRIGDII